MRIEIYKSRIKLKNPFITSLGSHEFAENIIVVIKTEQGINGFGECSPFLTINGESIDTCFSVGQLLAKALLKKDLSDIEACSAIMDQVIYGNSSIKSAFDIALHDIAAQEKNLPLYAFLGGNRNKTIITDYTVSIGNPEKMTADAEEIKKQGFKVIKVKLGQSPEMDLKRIRMIRQTIGDEIPLRIDANQGWSVDTAISILNDLSNYNIQFCEEPIPRWDFMELNKIKMKSVIPVMADESCCDHQDAKRLINLSACDYFNLKLGKSSGFIKAQKIVELAESAGIKMQVGGFLESRLGFTASAHLALTSDAITFFDFDTPLMLEEDIVNDGIIYNLGGIVEVPTKPGLGASVDEYLLKQMPKAIIE